MLKFNMKYRFNYNLTQKASNFFGCLYNEYFPNTSLFLRVKFFKNSLKKAFCINPIKTRKSCIVEL